MTAAQKPTKPAKNRPNTQRGGFFFARVSSGKYRVFCCAAADLAGLVGHVAQPTTGLCRGAATMPKRMTRRKSLESATTAFTLLMTARQNGDRALETTMRQQLKSRHGLTVRFSRKAVPA
jgi:hypothetical protein